MKNLIQVIVLIMICFCGCVIMPKRKLTIHFHERIELTKLRFDGFYYSMDSIYDDFAGTKEPNKGYSVFRFFSNGLVFRSGGSAIEDAALKLNEYSYYPFHSDPWARFAEDDSLLNIEVILHNLDYISFGRVISWNGEVINDSTFVLHLHDPRHSKVKLNRTYHFQEYDFNTDSLERIQREWILKNQNKRIVNWTKT